MLVDRGFLKLGGSLDFGTPGHGPLSTSGLSPDYSQNPGRFTRDLDADQAARTAITSERRSETPARSCSTLTIRGELLLLRCKSPLLAHRRRILWRPT